MLSGKRMGDNGFPERAIFPSVENMALSNMNDLLFPYDYCHLYFELTEMNYKQGAQI